MADHSLGLEKIRNGDVAQIHKAPEVQECIKAFRATAPNTVEQHQAFFAYGMALQKELEKSKFSAWPPGSAQIEALLHKLENGNANESDVAEFRRVAGEVLRHPRCSPGFKRRIQDALNLVE